MVGEKLINGVRDKFNHVTTLLGSHPPQLVEHRYRQRYRQRAVAHRLDAHQIVIGPGQQVGRYLGRPDMIISGRFNESPGRKTSLSQWGNDLFDHIVRTILGGGSILRPVRPAVDT